MPVITQRIPRYVIVRLEETLCACWAYDFSIISFIVCTIFIVNAYVTSACLKILQSRLAMNPTASIRSSTPNHMTSMRPYYPPQPPAPPVGIPSYDSQSQTSSGSGGGITLTPTQSGHHIRVKISTHLRFNLLYLDFVSDNASDLQKLNVLGVDLIFAWSTS